MATHIKRYPVLSGSLRSIGYDPKGEVLEVEFVHGGVYRYYDVQSNIYKTLLKAESKGAYYHSYVRDAGYRYEKVDE